MWSLIFGYVENKASKDDVYLVTISVFFVLSGVSLQNLLWVFAIKYWSIATKIELAINEEDIGSKNKLIGLLMYGGLATITVATGVLGVRTYIYVRNDFKQAQSPYNYDAYILIAAALLECLFLVSALLKFSRTQVENYTISKRLVYSLCFVYSFQFVGQLMFQL